MHEALISQENISFAKRLVSQFYRSYGSCSIEFDELNAVALLTLCECAKSFNPSKGMSFNSYAYLRIRGAMFDFLRQRIRQASLERHSSAHAASEPEVRSSSAREQTVDECLGLCLHRNQGICSLENLSYANRRSPEDICHSKYVHQLLRKLLGTLSKTEQEVLSLKYFDDCSFDEIREKMGSRSKTWVSTTHRKALDSLELALAQSLQPKEYAA